MNPLIEALAPDLLRLIKPGPQPAWIDPMLASRGNRPFSDPRWLFEQKYDGERCISKCSGGHIRLFSRNRTLLNQKLPEIVLELQAESGSDYIVDGEIIALRSGIPSFPELQHRIGISGPYEPIKGQIPVYYYLFDLMYLDGYDITRLPLLARKALLRNLFTYNGWLRFSGYREGDGEACFRNACNKGLEGIIAKRSDSAYHSRRSPDWQKFTCNMRQEFVIGGYRKEEHNMSGLGAILVGYFDGPRLAYAGKVGTGFDKAMVKSLLAVLHSLEQPENPFDEKISHKGVSYVRPVLIAMIGFAGWTMQGKLRHPHFIGIRSDKPAHEVIREKMPESEDGH